MGGRFASQPVRSSGTGETMSCVGRHIVEAWEQVDLAWVRRAEYEIGLDAAVVTTDRYGSDRIAHLRRGEECSVEQWAAVKRWLAREADPAVVLVEMVATLPCGHPEKPGILRAIEVLRAEQVLRGGDDEA